MTTFVVNNSVFRGFFEKQKLTRPNIIDWYRQHRIVLSVEDKLDYLEQPIPPAPIPAQVGHAFDMLQELKTLFAQQAEQELFETVKDFNSCKQEEGQSVSSYVLKMKIYIDNLERLDHPVSLNLGYLAELLKKKKLSQGASGSGIFTIELYTFPNKSWVYDTGCGTHICNTTQGLRGSRKLKPGALSLYVGNGQHTAVEAIRSYHLCLLGGLVIVLNNCHYAPSITRGIISVSRFYDDGYVNRFVDNTILVSRNNLVYFSAVPRDGIFEIDLSNSNTNDSSMYADYALETAARILNMVPTKKVEKTSYEVWHAQAPNMSYLKVWGCEALVKRDTLTKPDKLKPSSIKCIFVGYPKETMGYSFYYPPDNKVLVARNAEFLENSLITQEASRSLEDLKIIQEEDTHPSVDTSLNHKEDDLEIDEPQSDIIPIRRSIRTRRPIDRMCLYMDAEEHKLGDLSELANYKAALLDPEFDK
ncbi:retrotransposon protein, putative, ty1-copia subclass [Tanacetum coccineum]